MVKTGRNEPCPCGSKKKYKNCCLNKKPRETSILFEMIEPTKLTSIKIEEGQIKLLDSNGEVIAKNIYQQNTYKRIGKDNKVLNQIKLNVSKYSNEIDALLQYDIIYAVDTNTKNFNGENLSITSRQCCEFNSNKTTITFYPFGLACIKNIPNMNQEKFGIKLLISNILCDKNYNKNLKIGIIIDHDLGNLMKYNNRELPIYNDWYLPDNFTLIYASSDTGKEYLTNILISACDKEANNFFEEVKKGNIQICDFNDI